MDIKELFEKKTAKEIIAELKKKTIEVPKWEMLEKEYKPELHPVVKDPQYRDIVFEDGSVDKVSRITYDFQRLATHRMTELLYGIKTEREYDITNDKEQEVANYIESIFKKTRIDSVNIERSNLLFAGCEVMTLWYAVEDENQVYGFNSKLKIRCKNYSPMLGDKLYPLFDKDGDMVAMSVEYSVKEDKNIVTYFDTYTSTEHRKYVNYGTEWEQLDTETYGIGKIPAVYVYRQTPIWEDTSRIVYEMEWAMSHNGNFLRKNSKPIFVIKSSDDVSFGNEKDENKEFRSIIQLPSDGNAQYLTWNQAVENLKFYISELRQTFFTQLQLPDWSYESMKASPMSGESRKQLFIDAQLKCIEESGRLLEMHDREVNIVKSLLKIMLPNGYEEVINKLRVTIKLKPFNINDESETIKNLITANGGKALMSQKESIQTWGRSVNIENTIKQIEEENMKQSDIMDPSM